MKDILTIVFRLTVTCLVAGVIMGGGFVLTNKAKQDNEHKNEQRVMLSLLGYSKSNPAPQAMALHEIYRYVVSEGENLSVAYLLPANNGFTFVNIGLDGRFLSRHPVAISEEQVLKGGDRDTAIIAALGPGKSIRFADQTIVVTNGGKRQAYLLPGEFTGFKTFIKVILAVDQDFAVMGLEIMEHEEDPGLGGEIVQDYFKGQFTGKDFATIKKIKVAKLPLPDEYQQALEADKNGLNEAEVARIRALYSDKDIYALTGATISSRSVTNGVKGIVKKFAYRMSVLDRVLDKQQIAVPF
ncbi:MAG: FMN-binding protein [Proteobacteria bacterium]|nr:FMN-binding protein [Pseudomonadota bacterium]MBU1709053.1 FMN-binding protein [Pseudomonadota bacterium]